MIKVKDFLIIYSSSLIMIRLVVKTLVLLCLISVVASYNEQCAFITFMCHIKQLDRKYLWRWNFVHLRPLELRQRINFTHYCTS